MPDSNTFFFAGESSRPTTAPSSTVGVPYIYYSIMMG